MIENCQKKIVNLQKKLNLKFQNEIINKISTIKAIDCIDCFISGDWGQDISSEKFNESCYVLRGVDVNDISTKNDYSFPIRWINKNKLYEKELINYDIVIEISGGSPNQSTGRTCLITPCLLKQNNQKFVSSNFCRTFRCKSKKYAVILYLYLKKWYIENIFFKYENGTTGIKNLDYQSLLNEMEMINPANISNDFLLESLKIFDYMDSLYNRIKSLRKTKNTYLKKFFD